MTPPVALTIAGSDPSGGAGIQADLKTFHQFGVYGEAVITLLTVQNTRGVERIEYLPAELVMAQIRAVVDDIPPAVAKTGALGTRQIIEMISDMATHFRFPLIIDPVLSSKNGAALLSPDAVDALKTHLLPRAFLLLPNLEEAGILTGVHVHDIASMQAAAQRLTGMGARAVLVKGGHLVADSTDVLLYEGRWLELWGPRVDTRHTHGTGCTFSAAITALLALGHDLPTAVTKAKAYITEAICGSPALGAGAGPVNHHAKVPCESAHKTT